jgi:TetR/AcrR family transcriptional regulator, repressor for neighboring sulfatase
MPLRPRRPLRRAVRAIRRRRRAPDDARREILDAAERLFASAHPDALGLKPVARAAGVSHALITHYFGTYAGLVDAVLERRQLATSAAIVERLRASGTAVDPDTLLAILFDALGDPVQVRLWLWMLASERPAADDFFPLEHQGLRTVAAEVARAIAGETGVPVAALLPDVELALLVAVAAAFGFNLGKRGLVGSLGRSPTPALDVSVRTTLGTMLASHLRQRAEALASR